MYGRWRNSHLPAAKDVTAAFMRLKNEHSPNEGLMAASGNACRRAGCESSSANHPDTPTATSWYGDQKSGERMNADAVEVSPGAGNSMLEDVFRCLGESANARCFTSCGRVG